MPAEGHVQLLAPIGCDVLRRLVPLMLVPLGALYCQTYELFFQPARGSVLESLFWAGVTLGPWVVAAMLFEFLAARGESNAQRVRRAAMLGIGAYLLSAFAALALGGDNYRAFYSRLPLLVAALFLALLYRVPSRQKAEAGVAANDDVPPIAPREITFASAAGNYVELHAQGRSAIWRQTMHNAERILSSAGFVRVHRSYLVPRRGIETVTRGRSRAIEVELRDGRRVPVSNRYAANLRD
ncbi:MAG TPA: LytTR family DNA-binding domain-containing protein [Sphingomonas sp.]|nr:LytTR family DNA-binding domain-containing protein [Sphingomonas sp.]